MSLYNKEDKLPKKTFYNLGEGKKQNITDILLSEFSNKPFSKVSVKTIVERLGIARGSFYQYFEDLKDSYFYILDMETYDIHILFMKSFKKNEADIYKSLDDFGLDIAEVIFKEDVYNLYKNRFLYWDENLNKNWLESHSNYNLFFKRANAIGLDEEKLYFFRAIIHSLIERNFREEWDKDTFIEKYRTHMKRIKEGVFNENS